MTEREHKMTEPCTVSTAEAPYDYSCSYCGRLWIRPVATGSFAVLAQCHECKGVAVFGRRGELMTEAKTLEKFGQPHWSPSSFILIGFGIGFFLAAIEWFVKL